MATKYTVVAFRYDQAHSVLYETVYRYYDVAPLVDKALNERNADVISIRKVYESCPIPPKPTS